MFFFRKFTTKFSLNDNHVTILLLRKATFRQRNSSVWAKIMWSAKTQIIVTRARKWLCYSPNGTAVNNCEQLESLSCLFTKQPSNWRNFETFGEASSGDESVSPQSFARWFTANVSPDYILSKSWSLFFFSTFSSFFFFFVTIIIVGYKQTGESYQRR